MFTEKLAEPAKAGIRKSLQLLWLLAKIIIPVSCLVSILNHYGLMDVIAAYFNPVMTLVGLPGEAAIALTLGFFVNFYAALPIIAGSSLSPQQVTIMALMLGICHELPVESAICAHTGLKLPVSMLLRLTVAVAAGIMLNFIFTILS
jgi:hypothetical protein